MATVNEAIKELRRPRYVDDVTLTGVIEEVDPSATAISFTVSLDADHDFRNVTVDVYEQHVTAREMIEAYALCEGDEIVVLGSAYLLDGELIVNVKRGGLGVRSLMMTTREDTRNV